MSRDELRNEIDMLQGNINRMMVSDDIKEIGTMFYYASNRLSTIFKENIDRVCEAEDIKEKILEYTAELEADYNICIKDMERTKNCSTCKNNVEFPDPHTCDICTSLDQEE